MCIRDSLSGVWAPASPCLYYIWCIRMTYIILYWYVKTAKGNNTRSSPISTVPVRTIDTTRSWHVPGALSDHAAEEVAIEKMAPPATDRSNHFRNESARTYIPGVDSCWQRSGATDGINQKRNQFLKKMVEKMLLWGFFLQKKIRTGAARAEWSYS